MSPKIYAQALARVLTKKPSAAEEKKIITNLLIAVRFLQKHLVVA